MGAGEGGYVRITLQTRTSEFNAEENSLHRVSELRFSTAQPPDDLEHASIPELATLKPGPQPASPPAGKLGLGGVSPGSVTVFRLFARMDDGSFMDMGLAPHKLITSELEEAFGGTWAGFAVALAPAGGRFRLVADITFEPSWGATARKPLQVIPVVMAFGTDRFVDHYLLAVIAAQKTADKVDTAIVQPYR